VYDVYSGGLRVVLLLFSLEIFDPKNLIRFLNLLSFFDCYCLFIVCINSLDLIVARVKEEFIEGEESRKSNRDNCSSFSAATTTTTTTASNNNIPFPSEPPAILRRPSPPISCTVVDHFAVLLLV
jgi:hypothetical protein